ncbi:MAG: hypothetical protein H0T94_00855 [Acidimicrobiia bacterium]|nr:hypothetical protein [Acidimicrobiia bacterium]
MATGSEVHLALEAAAWLSRQGIDITAVSMPCREASLRQDLVYRESVIDPTRPVATLEADSTFGWAEVAGSGGLTIGIDHFGPRAPGEVLAETFGFTAEAGVAGRDLGAPCIVFQNPCGFDFRLLPAEAIVPRHGANQYRPPGRRRQLVRALFGDPSQGSWCGPCPGDRTRRSGRSGRSDRPARPFGRVQNSGHLPFDRRLRTGTGWSRTAYGGGRSRGSSFAPGPSLPSACLPGAAQPHRPDSSDPAGDQFPGERRAGGGFGRGGR